MSFIDTALSAIKTFFLGGGPGGDPPEWLSRIYEAKYKSPSGQEVPFSWGDIDIGVEKKTSAFENATGNGTYVQDNGTTGGRFPIAAFFSGNNNDQRAQAFLSALVETGQGVLSHPLYGNIDVVPTGEIKVLSPLSTGANVTTVVVEFWETTGLNFGGGGDTDSFYNDLLTADAVDFSNKVNLNDVSEIEAFKNKVVAGVKTTQRVLNKASEGIASVQSGIENIGDSINSGIDLLVGQPLGLARQCQILVGEPARQLQSIQNKLDGYSNMASSIFGEDPSASKYIYEASNSFHFNKLLGSAALGNFAKLGALADFDNRADYLNAADILSGLLDDYREWRANGFEIIERDTVSVEGTETGDGMQELETLVSSALNSLVAGSMDARTEITVVTDREHTPIDLCYELYGTIEHLDFFIESNDLSGDEYMIIEQGREIVYYV